MSNTELPDEIWSRWSKPEYDPLRQVVLCFGGNVRTEAIIDSFPDVSLLIPEGENTTVIKGVFYLTTRRMAFLPRNTINSNIVQASFESLRCITGTRSDLTTSVVDANGSTAKFQLSTAQVLYQCFNMFRHLAEASRLSEDKFRSVVYKVATAPRRDETPFNSIEVELQECTEAPEVPAAPVVELGEEVVDPVTIILAPVKSFFDYFNSLHFDIHIKLRILCVMAFVSFCLQYIPFLVFMALLTILFLLLNAWKSINKDLEDEEKQEPVIPALARGFVSTDKFLMSYFGWKDPRKSMNVLQTCCAIILAWIILPSKIYPIACVVAYVYFILTPLKTSVFFQKYFCGPWFST